MNSYIINLERRRDRLEALNIPFEYEIFTAVDGLVLSDHPLKLRGAMGCLRSHISLLEQIKDLKLDKALIFEDDVVLCDDFEMKFENILKQLPKDWDLLYLGGWNIGEIKKYSDGLNIAEKVYTTHAYLIRDKFIDTALSSLKSRDWKADVLLAECLQMGKCFICDPVLAWQKEGYSDIVYKNTNNVHLQ